MVPFVRLKANKKFTPDVFLGSTDLRGVSLIHLMAKITNLKLIKQQARN